jgi:hypothetical protein
VDGGVQILWMSRHGDDFSAVDPQGNAVVRPVDATFAHGFACLAGVVA